MCDRVQYRVWHIEGAYVGPLPLFKKMWLKDIFVCIIYFVDNLCSELYPKVKP